MTKSLLLTTAALLAISSSAALAQSKGDMTLGLGLAWVNPAEDNGDLLSGALDVDVAGDTQLSLTFEYFLMDNLGLEVLAATPFTQKVDVNDSHAVDVKHLPPTVSLNYHFPTSTGFTPFVGLGVNYTTVLSLDDQDISGLDIKDSWGWAGNVGFDYALNDKSALRFNVRYIDIDLDVDLNGDDIGTVNVDPWVIGASYIIRF